MNLSKILSCIGSTSINQIRYFVSVYELGSISKAAKECGVSQPAVSKGIKSIERQLDMDLFYRDTKSCRPTEPAKKLYPKFLEICSSSISISNILNSITSGDYGEIKIGLGKIVGPLGSRLISSIIKNKFQNLKITVIQDTPSNLQRSLLQGNLDFFICHNEALSSTHNIEQVRSRPFANIKIEAVVSPNAEFLKNGDDLTLYPWAFPNLEVVSTSKNNFYNNYFKRIEDNRNILYEIDDVDARLRLALSGQAAIISTKFSVVQYINSGSLIRLPVDIDDIELCVYHNNLIPLSNKAKYIIDSMKELFSNLST